MEKIKGQLTFHGCFTVNSDVKSGVLCLLWKDDVDI